ncbi:RtcB family protein, partial [Escherichia coli]|uniref:RtcB family protein n=1 Tax=Escherichia coli TaxID=562 RepID=UPI00136F5722
IGTLGGGNHFIEVNQGSDGIYLVIHSGSRVLGQEIAEYHQEVAYKRLDILRKELKLDATAAKKRGNLEMANNLNGEREQVKFDYDLSYVTGSYLNHYLNDMEIAQKFAARNRYIMAETILKAMKWNKAVVSAFD